MSGLLARLYAYLLGVHEYRLDITTNPGEDLIPAYDRGRALARRLMREDRTQ